jgi:hypothetical protein
MTSDVQLREACRQAVMDGVARVVVVAEHGDFPAYTDFPSYIPMVEGARIPAGEVRLLGGGFTPAPRDYRRVLGAGSLKDVILNAYTFDAPLSWTSFLDAAKANDRLNVYYDLPERGEKWGELVVRRLLAEITNRYVHLAGLAPWSDQQFDEVFTQWYNAVFAERLDFDVLVPLVGLEPTTDDMEVDFAVNLTRLDEAMQRVRHVGYNRSDGPPDTATHALVLRSWYLENDTQLRNHSALRSVPTLRPVLELADVFLAAVRSELGIHVGYSQVVIRHTGWADAWYAALPPVTTFQVRALPVSMPHLPVAESSEPPSATALDTCAQAYRTLARGWGDNRVKTAIRRLNATFLREDEDDAILDVTIGLEALLSADEQSEITHRLKAYLAALLTLEPLDGYDAARMFAAVGHVYNLRSKVVHGTTIKPNLRTLVRDDGEAVPTVHEGLHLLRYVLRTFVRHPELLGKNELGRLLARALAVAASISHGET